ncbi:MAG: alpha-galactosidase [Kiritimatiellae bacterium]|jgi:alpha-galactosidase|nr:alpha-galactosidase [Kiritimatiellia bacterium]
MDKSFHETASQQANASTEAARLAEPVTLPFEKELHGSVVDYEMLTFSGDAMREYLLKTRRIPATGFRFVQKKGRSATTLKPWVAVRNTKTGQGIAVLIAYSGNWVIEIKPLNGRTVLRVETFPSGLKPFAEFGGMPIPGALVATFADHWDDGSQAIVRFIRSKLLRDMGPDWPPVQYNTWYDAYEKINDKQLFDAARVAAGIGCEQFTIDAGWYGAGAKADWSGELGNWEVNLQRFPCGLEPIAKEVRRLGMKLGLWIEIECASPNSQVVMEHPEWILKHGDRQLSDRTALDFKNPDVVAWAKSVIDHLVTTYALDYIKMDFNTDLPVDGERLTPETDPLYRHYRGLVELLKHIRTSYPKLIVENCSSGSLRQDAMTVALTDTHWVSDNVDNPVNLAMNHGATYLFPPEICSHWTVSPTAHSESPIDRETSFTANLLGHFGLSGKICEWDAQTLKVAAERITLFKKIRERIRNADVFHLTPQINVLEPCSMQAALYANPQSSEALLFVFHGGDPSLGHTLVLRGVNPDRSYHLSMPEGYGADQVVAGEELLEKGLTIRFPHKGASAVIIIDPQ